MKKYLLIVLILIMTNNLVFAYNVPIYLMKPLSRLRSSNEKIFLQEQEIKEVDLIKTVVYTKYTGQIKVYYPNGNLKESITYLNGVLNGKEVIYYPNGNIMYKTSWKDGNKNGEEIIYTKNNDIENKTVYKDGLEEKSFLYNEGEIFMESFYKKGEKYKEIDYYSYKPKQIRGITNFKNNKMNGDSFWYYKNGNIMQKYYVKDNKKQGKGIFYYENGSIKCEYKYKDDVVIKQNCR